MTVNEARVVKRLFRGYYNKEQISRVDFNQLFYDIYQEAKKKLGEEPIKQNEL